jgi:hypothetical protein
MLSQEGFCASNLEPETIRLLWQDWLAAGKFHILAGAVTGQVIGEVTGEITGEVTGEVSEEIHKLVLILKGEMKRTDIQKAFFNRLHFVTISFPLFFRGFFIASQPLNGLRHAHKILQC